MTLDELTYDLAGTYDHEPPSDRPLMPSVLARVSCPFCGDEDGGLYRRSGGPAQWHVGACPVVMVDRHGQPVPDLRRTIRPLNGHRSRLLTSEVS